MTEQLAYYSLVQYAPDPSRREAANVGVVLFAPEDRFLAARMARSNEHVRRFFGKDAFDSNWLRLAKRSIAERLVRDAGRFETLDDFERFVRTRGNELLLTDPRPVKVAEPRADLDGLFEELVSSKIVRRRREPTVPELERVFRRPELKGKIEFGRKVPIPQIGRTLRAEYAYRNGSLNLIKAQTLSEKSDAVDRCSLLATEARFLQKERNALIVVPEFRSRDDSWKRTMRKILGNIFAESDVRVVWQEQREHFADEVARTAH